MSQPQYSDDDVRSEAYKWKTKYENVNSQYMFVSMLIIVAFVAMALKMLLS